MIQRIDRKRYHEFKDVLGDAIAMYCCILWIFEALWARLWRLRRHTPCENRYAPPAHTLFFLFLFDIANPWL